jgi:ABC-2 type transport system permease protein
MSTQPNVMSEVARPTDVMAADVPWSKRFYWSVRRELWEFRSIYLVQFAVAGIFVFGFLLSLIRLPHKMNHLATLDPMQQRELIEQPFQFAAGLIMAAGFLVAIFYALEALQSERRDRSILFWKSLPISDTSTVLSKIISATMLAPIVAVVTGIIVGMLPLLILAVTLSFHGVNVWQLLVLAHPFRVMANLIGYIPLYVLWALPSVGWLLLCSAWARNKPFLWAVALPVATGLLVSWFGIMGLFDLPTIWFWKNIVQRGLFSVFPGTGSVFGHQGDIAVTGNPGMDFMDLGNTYQLLASTNLWIGVAVGLGLLAGAIWFRRWRDDS